jgi:exodeoxyribonuclease VII large subunit
MSGNLLPMESISRPDTLTPSQLNTLARTLLEDAFPLVWVEGELGNVARPSSGHLYFALKDERAQVRCAMFRPKSTWLKFVPREGLRVLARGRLTLYEARGEYQLVVDHMEEAGEGALRRAFEALQAKLAAEGLFDDARKQPLPAWVRRLGVITSPTGAAVRDVLSVLARRCPLLEVEVLPVPVQGEGAAAQIAAMLRRADASGRYDALLLARGGGSLEDLWAFNDEALARAIAAARTPVVSAVGHETDFTLADFAADLRAPTPSVAAELLVPHRDDLLRRIAAAGRQLLLALRPRAAIARRLGHETLRLRGLARALEGVSPLATVARGYAILQHHDGRIVRRTADAAPGDRLQGRVSDGVLPLRVEKPDPL